MAEERRIDITVGAKDEASSVVKRTVEKVKKELGTLDKLKVGLGEESALGNTLKVLQGSGAVAALSMLGQQVNRFADGLRNLTIEADGSRKSWGSLIEQLAIGIPIFGQFVEAGRKIRGELSGDADEADRMQKWASATDQLTEAYKRMLALRVEYGRSVDQQITTVRGQMSILNAPEIDRPTVSAGVSKQAMLDEVERQRERMREQLQDAWREGSKALREQAAAASGVRAGAQSYYDMFGNVQGFSEGARKKLDEADRQLQAKQNELKSSRETLQSGLDDIDRNAAKARAEIEKFGDATIEQSRRERARRLLEIEEKAAADRLAIVRKTTERITELEQSAEDKRLRFQGNTSRADALDVSRSARKAMAEAMKGEPSGNVFNDLTRLAGSVATVGVIRQGMEQDLDLQWRTRAGNAITGFLRSAPSVKDLLGQAMQAPVDAYRRNFGGTGPARSYGTPLEAFQAGAISEEELRKAYNIGDPMRMARTAPSRDTRFLTGVSITDPALREQRKTNDLVEQVKRLIEEQNRVLREGGTVKVFPN